MIKGGNSKGRFHNRKLLHFGVDYIKSYIEYDYKPKLYKMGLSANSNFAFLNDDTYIELLPSDMYKWFERYYVIVDKETKASLAFIMIPKVWKVGAISYNNVYEVTGQGLLLRDIKFYFDIIKWLWFKIDKFKRVDLCFDMEEDIEYYYKRVLDKFIEDKTGQTIKKKWVVETIYIWERNTKKNTYQLIRIYNKKLDTKVKGKELMYDYKAKDFVTRFEVELRRDRCKFLTEEKLLDDWYIFSVIVKTFYKMNYQYFKYLHLEDFEKVRINESTRQARKNAIKKRIDRQNEFWKDFYNSTEEEKIIKLYITYAKRLYWNGYKKSKLSRLLWLHGINEVPKNFKHYIINKNLRFYNEKIRFITRIWPLA